MSEQQAVQPTTNTRTLTGRVTSNKMQKTVTVLVERKVRHPVYGKYVVQSKKYHAHTEDSFNEGDVVEIQEGKPVSRTKSWYVTRLLTAAKVV
ncbi:30S ribosomal protein S17 [Lautropia dentalis]|jgi:30S ribosomal protein S17|uniref:Small ribosomal subunit protein uS17 n=1 Tax=Lautropia dentalis TaxID=2490857 RepID=A0A426FLE7_9BURK|nr:30S ribosomal protein S17 [Lautropia dentalis]RRN43549.1 30S ribosomal protein S17 [Lautropia dentalis]